MTNDDRKRPKTNGEVTDPFLLLVQVIGGSVRGLIIRRSEVRVLPAPPRTRWWQREEFSPDLSLVPKLVPLGRIGFVGESHLTRQGVPEGDLSKHSAARSSP